MISITLGGSGLNAWAKPSSFTESSKAQFGAMPGLTWDRAQGRYEGAEEALRLVVAKLEAAGVSVTKGAFDLSPQCIALSSQLGSEYFAGARDYQLDGIGWIRYMLRETGGALLADEMGIGKTAQAIMALEGTGPTLVLAPAIAVPHWAGQLRRWLRDPALADQWLVMSPEKFQREWAKRGKEGPCSVADLEFSNVVLDEIHYYSNPAAKRTKAVAELLASAAVRPNVLGLTGTPIQTKVANLWSVLDLLWPGRFGKAFAFQKRYCDGRFEEIEGCVKPVWIAKGSSHLEELQSRLSACMLRRTKAQVALELPALQRDIREIELPALARRSEKQAIKGQDDWTAASIDALLNSVEAYKVDAACELAREVLEAGGRPLILARTRAVADQIGAALGCPVATGDVPASDRRAALLSGEGAAVSTIYAVTTGIDLVEFDTVIFTGPDWVPANLLQAEARLWRLGQLRSVTAYYLVGLGTVDEVIRERVIDRLEMLATVTGSEGDSAELAKQFSGGTDDQLLAQLVSDIQKKASGKK